MNFPSLEHVYQFQQSMVASQPDLAYEIQNAAHAGKAKSLSKKIPAEPRENWEKLNVGFMKELLHVKANQFPDFRSALLVVCHQL